MCRDILLWARQCQACVSSKIAIHTNPPILPISTPQERFSHVHVDIVGPFAPDRGFKYLLTMIDRTTRWPEAVPVADTTADTVVQTFQETWVSQLGVPFTVTSDRVAQFTSETWRTAFTRLGINISLMTAYHPQSNGIVERFHRTLKNTLRCAICSSKSWMRSLTWAWPPQRAQATGPAFSGRFSGVDESDLVDSGRVNSAEKTKRMRSGTYCEGRSSVALRCA